MTLANFLKLHQDTGVCVSIHQLPYDHVNNTYTKIHFEECSQDEIMESELYKSIKNRTVDHFCVIGGGMYDVELVIELKEEIK